MQVIMHTGLHLVFLWTVHRKILKTAYSFSAQRICLNQINYDKPTRELQLLVGFLGGYKDMNNKKMPSYPECLNLRGTVTG